MGTFLVRKEPPLTGLKMPQGSSYQSSYYFCSVQLVLSPDKLICRYVQEGKLAASLRTLLLGPACMQSHLSHLLGLEASPACQWILSMVIQLGEHVLKMSILKSKHLS